jgi:hypothetical protein
MSLKKLYKQEVKAGLERTGRIKPEKITEEDLQYLPAIVRKYLNYVGIVGKEKVVNIRIEFTGRIRSKPGDGWMKLSSQQYNFFDNPTRIFYITARKMGIPAGGIHLYKDKTAFMTIKILGLFTIVDARGEKMDQAETVTFFNDMCFMAPATLIDKNIQWKEIDYMSVEARFTNGHLSIGAKLIFNEKGELINFVSNDRYETADGKTLNNYPWSTPVKGYRDFNGIKLATGASTIYHHPDIDFCYGEFELKDIKYNSK